MKKCPIYHMTDIRVGRIQLKTQTRIRRKRDMKIFRVDDIVKWGKGEKQRFGAVFGVKGDRLEIVPFEASKIAADGSFIGDMTVVAQHDFINTLSISASRVQKVKPFIVSVAQQRALVRYEIDYKALKKQMFGDGGVFAIKINDCYEVRCEDLIEAVSRMKESGLPLASLRDDWFDALADPMQPLSEVIDRAIEQCDEKASDNGVFDEYSIVIMIWSMIRRVFSKNSTTTFDDVLNEYQVWLENKDVPLEERKFTTLQKEEFIAHWNTKEGDIPEVYKNLYVNFFYELLLENNEFVLSVLNDAYGSRTEQDDEDEGTGIRKDIISILQSSENFKAGILLRHQYSNAFKQGMQPKYAESLRTFTMQGLLGSKINTERFAESYMNGDGVKKNPYKAISMYWSALDYVYRAFQIDGERVSLLRVLYTLVKLLRENKDYEMALHCLALIRYVIRDVDEVKMRDGMFPSKEEIGQLFAEVKEEMETNYAFMLNNFGNFLSLQLMRSAQTFFTVKQISPTQHRLVFTAHRAEAFQKEADVDDEDIIAFFHNDDMCRIEKQFEFDIDSAQIDSIEFDKPYEFDCIDDYGLIGRCPSDFFKVDGDCDIDMLFANTPSVDKSSDDIPSVNKSSDDGRTMILFFKEHQFIGSIVGKFTLM